MKPEIIKLNCPSATCQGKLTDHKVYEYKDYIVKKCTECTWIIEEPKDKE
jgi:hypothetical protein